MSKNNNDGCGCGCLVILFLIVVAYLLSQRVDQLENHQQVKQERPLGVVEEPLSKGDQK